MSRYLGRGWGRVARWTGALMLTATLAGCGSQDNDPGGSDVTNGSESSLSPERADKQMAQYRETVRGETKQVGRALAEAVDGQLMFAFGRYTLCTDDGAGWAYDVSGRVDPPADAPRPLYEPVSSGLKELGYAVEERVAPSGDARVIADRGQVTVTVLENDDAPNLLLFRVSSPCLIIPEEQRASYPRDEPSPDVVPVRK